MRFIDRVLQRWRIRKALNFLPSGVRVIDVGAHQGELFKALGKNLTEGFGVEPLVHKEMKVGGDSITRGFFPEGRPESKSWGALTMLAVLEHIPENQHSVLADACHDLLAKGGRVIITVPSKAVDTVLEILKAIGLIDGMSLEEHYGFQPRETVRIFSTPRFHLRRHARFQLGLNHLYVFEKV